MKKVFLGLSLTLATSLFSAETNNSATNQVNGKILIEKYGCTACHNIMGRKNAPAFMGIARKNLMWNSFDEAKTTLVNSIKNGSQGKYRRFANTAMPPYKDVISETEINTIASWILSEYENNKDKIQNQMKEMHQKYSCGKYSFSHHGFGGRHF
jgi:cytochrome c